MPVVPPFQLLDRYDVIEEIGRGGHAVVYRAHDRALSRDVAVKVLREDVLAPAIKARFTQEIQVMATLQHPHILHVHDSGTFEGQPFVVMALAPAKTLAHRLEREPQLPVQDAVQIAREVGSALAHAHARGVLHRDVKPENILLSEGGAILADFGIARVTGELAISRITSTGEAVGTLQYMSPEQLCAEPVDARSDQYALACVLYEMLAGVHPHPAATFEALRALRLMGRQTPLSVMRPSVSPVLEEVVARAMAVTPADRFRSMDEFLLALDLTRTGDATIVGVTGGGTAIRSDSRGHAAVAAPVRRSSPRGWAVGAVVFAAVAGGAWWSRRGASESPTENGPSVSIELGGDSLTRAFGERVQRELSAWSGVTLTAREGTWRLTPSATSLGDSVQWRLEASGAPLVPPDSDTAAPTRVVVSRMLSRAALATADDRIAAMVREALAGVPVSEAPGLDGLPARSVPALRAYVRGHALVRAGLLDSAAASFRAARDVEPRFAQARFWAAQSAAWSTPKAVDRWKSDADEAVRLGTLHGVDSLLAVGLQHMAGMRFPEACGAYRKATEVEAGSFVGWMGLGECQRLDDAVLRRAGTHHFRSSPWSAVTAFEKAIDLAPSPAMLELCSREVRSLLYVSGNSIRLGQDAEGASFAAYPALNADTLAFHPIPLTALTSGDPRWIPDSWLPALTAGRLRSIRIHKQIAERFPASAILRFRFAVALELAGKVDSRDPNAAAAVLASVNQHQLPSHELGEYSLTHVRILLRQGQIDSAVVAAAAMQRAGVSLTDSTMLALAAFAGDTATLLSSARVPTSADLPESIRTPLASLVRAQLSANCRRIQAAYEGVLAALSSGIAASQQGTIRESTILPIVRNAIPCLPPETLDQFRSTLPFDSAVRDIGRGHHADALRRLKAIASSRRGATQASITWDFQFLESWALVQAGDTAAAIERLVSAFDDLASMSQSTLQVPEQASALRQSLRLLQQATHEGMPTGVARRTRERLTSMWLPMANRVF